MDNGRHEQPSDANIREGYWDGGGKGGVATPYELEWIGAQLVAQLRSPAGKKFLKFSI